jgi:hypothetical protein
MTDRRDDLETWERGDCAAAASVIEALRRERRACPPATAISAAAAGALPDDEQRMVDAHVATCHLCRDLQADFERIEPAELDAGSQHRILVNVRRRAEAANRPSPFGWRILVPVSVGFAVLVLIAVAWRRPGPVPAGPTPGSRAVAVAQPAVPPPSAEKPPAAAPGPALEKPEIKLSILALTWRGAADGRGFAEEIAPALDAFRSDRFDEAARALGALAPRYPTSVEVPYYEGVSLLFLGRPADAVGQLRRARRLADATFAPDIDWYLGVALYRAGHATEARARFASICRGAGPYATRACGAFQ